MSDSFGDVSSANFGGTNTATAGSSNADLQEFVEKEQQRAQFSAQVKNDFFYFWAFHGLKLIACHFDDAKT